MSRAWRRDKVMGSSQRTAVAQPRSSQAQTSSPSLGCAGDSTTHVSCDILISEARPRPTTRGWRITGGSPRVCLLLGSGLWQGQGPEGDPSGPSSLSTLVTAAPWVLCCNATPSLGGPPGPACPGSCHPVSYCLGAPPVSPRQPRGPSRGPGCLLPPTPLLQDTWPARGTSCFLLTALAS